METALGGRRLNSKQSRHSVAATGWTQVNVWCTYPGFQELMYVYPAWLLGAAGGAIETNRTLPMKLLSGTSHAKRQPQN